MFLKFFKFVVMQRVTRVYQRQLSYLSVIVHTGRLAMFSYVYGDRTIKTCIHVPVAGQWRRGYYYGDVGKAYAAVAAMFLAAGTTACWL